MSSVFGIGKGLSPWCVISRFPFPMAASSASPGRRAAESPRLPTLSTVSSRTAIRATSTARSRWRASTRWTPRSPICRGWWAVCARTSTRRWCPRWWKTRSSTAWRTSPCRARRFPRAWTRRLTPWASLICATAPSTACPAARSRRWRWPRCWRCAPKCSCWTSLPPSWTRPRR